MDCFGDGSFLPGGSQSNDAFYDGYQPHALSNEEWMCAFDESVSPTLQLSTAETLEIKGPDDPYLCSLCDFVTLYRVFLPLVCAIKYFQLAKQDCFRDASIRCCNVSFTFMDKNNLCCL